MRNAFRDQVHDAAKRDERVVLLSGDIGNRMFDTFKEHFPDRFYNTGIAEQNMVGMAAGLAMAGLRPVCYTIANFLTYRVIEQIRLDACYHHLPVIFAGVGGGLSYASLGATHHTPEDLAMLRVLPGMTVLTPGDAMEVRSCVDAALAIDDGPTYLRLGKKDEPVYHDSPPAFSPGRWLHMRGPALRDVNHDPATVILSAGNILPVAIEAVERGLEAGLNLSLYSCPSVKPLDTALLQNAFVNARGVVTLEEHSRLGGFGSAILEWINDAERDRTLRAPAPLLRLGTADVFLHRTGSQDYARAAFGLSPDAVLDSIRSFVTKNPSPSATALA
jgi:transketolase